MKGRVSAFSSDTLSDVVAGFNQQSLADAAPLPRQTMRSGVSPLRDCGILGSDRVRIDVQIWQCEIFFSAFARRFFLSTRQPPSLFYSRELQKMVAAKFVVLCLVCSLRAALSMAPARTSATNNDALALFEGACAARSFSSVMPLFPFSDPSSYVVRDMTKGLPPRRRRGCGLLLRFASVSTPRCTKFDVGKFDERRKIYTSSHFQNISNSIDGFRGIRDVHVGLDLGAPVGTSVHAPLEGRIFGFGYNSAEGDYGHVVITEHEFQPENLTFWLLFGHLNKESVAFKAAGDVVLAGQQIGAVGPPSENGGWPPHLHFQVSLLRPSHPHDMPGAVSIDDRPDALQVYPNPQLLISTAKTLY